MAAVTKTIAILCFLAMTCAACAVSVGETRGESEEILRNSNSKEIVQLAYEKLDDALAKLDEKIGTCDDRGTKTTVPLHLLPTFPLSDNEWKTALLHLSFKAMDRCDEGTLLNAVMAFTQFEEVEKKLTGKNALMEKSLYSLQVLCCGAVLTEMETELKYRKIDPAIRQALERIPELKQPFDPVKTFDAMSRSANSGKESHPNK